MSRQGYDVCAAVASDLTFDARVWKEVRSLAGAGYRVKLVGCAYELASPRRRTEGDIELVEIPLGSRSGGISLRGRARTALTLWLEVLRTDARVYHSHNIHIGPAGWLASRVRGARLVYDAHELYGVLYGEGVFHQVAARIGQAVERFMVQRSDLVLTTNRSRVEELGRRHGERPIEIVANVPGLVDDVAPLDPGFPTAELILLYQGGIYAESRAFREAIEALALLDDGHLVIIGFGRETAIERVRTWASELGMTDRVHLLPPRPFDELVRTAAAATVGLVPVKPDNLNNRLGDTNKLFEYLMAGLPVAASDIPEVRRVVTQGEPPVGELFDPEVPASIADAVRRIVADPERYQARRREARRLAVERFNWRLEERKLLDRYAELVPPNAVLVEAAA